MLITERLDRIASDLESQGRLHDAYEMDIIANTIEAFDIGDMLKRGFEKLKGGAKGTIGTVANKLKALAGKAKASTQQRIQQNLANDKRAKEIGAELAKAVIQAGVLQRSKKAAEQGGGQAGVVSLLKDNWNEIEKVMKSSNPSLYKELAARISNSTAEAAIEGTEDAAGAQSPSGFRSNLKKFLMGALPAAGMMVPFGLFDNGAMYYLAKPLEHMLHSVTSDPQMIDLIANAGSDGGGVLAAIPIILILRAVGVKEPPEPDPGENAGFWRTVKTYFKSPKLYGDFFGVVIGCLLGTAPKLLSMLASEDNESGASYNV